MGSRFAQFKLVLLGTDGLPADGTRLADVVDRRVRRREGTQTATVQQRRADVC